MAELKTAFWVSALIRRAEIGGAFALVARKGDADAGAVLLRVRVSAEEARLWGPARNARGQRIYLDLSTGPLGCDPQKIDDYVARRCGQDPDLWVVEIDDANGRHFLTEHID